jgi:hypothetical protein
LEVGRRRADKVIEISDGRTTAEKVKADTAERMRKSRAKKSMSRDIGSEERPTTIDNPPKGELFDDQDEVTRPRQCSTFSPMFGNVRLAPTQVEHPETLGAEGTSSIMFYLFYLKREN